MIQTSFNRERWRSLVLGVPRGLALFLGLFALLNIVGELRAPGFDANPWWINLPGDWQWLDRLLLGWSACCLLWFAGRRRLVPTQRNVLAVTFGLLILVSLWNVVTFAVLLSRDVVHTLSPIPFSALVAMGLIVVLGGLWWPLTDASASNGRRSRLYDCSIGMTFVMCGLLFPVAQMVCFGMTDYRRPADVAVVFGAKVHANGDLSSILEERVRTGCELYHSGLAKHVVFSGGPGVGAVHETEGMRRRALELGVPVAAITLDRDGWDTDLTAINTLRLARQRGWKRVLAVSQFFHLPRIKLAYHRHGSEVHTVPAMRIYKFRYLPYYMLREVAAWWWYYVRPLW